MNLNIVNRAWTATFAACAITLVLSSASHAAGRKAKVGAIPGSISSMLKVTPPGSTSEQCLILFKADFNKKYGVLMNSKCEALKGLKEDSSISLARSAVSELGSESVALEFLKDKIDAEHFYFAGSTNAFQADTAYFAMVDKVDMNVQVSKQNFCVLRMTVDAVSDKLSIYFPASECENFDSIYSKKRVQFDYASAHYFGKGKQSQKMINALKSSTHPFVLGYEGKLNVVTR